MDQEPDLSAKDPDTIRHQIEETRSSLTDKLEALEHEVRETARSATNAVVGTVESVKQTVESTVETVKEKVQGTVDTVKHTFDLKVQVEEHPWVAFGGSVAAGFVAGSLLPHDDWMARAMSRHPGGNGAAAPYAGTHHAGFQTPTGQPAAPPYQRPQPEASAVSEYATMAADKVGEVAQRFAPEIDRIKGLAIGAAMGLIRDFIKRSAPPSFAPQLSEIVDDVTMKLGGQPVKGEVLHSSHTRA